MHASAFSRAPAGGSWYLGGGTRVPHHAGQAQFRVSQNVSSRDLSGSIGRPAFVGPFRRQERGRLEWLSWRSKTVGPQRLAGSGSATRRLFHDRRQLTSLTSPDRSGKPLGFGNSFHFP